MNRISALLIILVWPEVSGQNGTEPAAEAFVNWFKENTQHILAYTTIIVSTVAVLVLSYWPQQDEDDEETKRDREFDRFLNLKEPPKPLGLNVRWTATEHDDRKTIRKFMEEMRRLHRTLDKKKNERQGGLHNVTQNNSNARPNMAHDETTESSLLTNQEETNLYTTYANEADKNNNAKDRQRSKPQFSSKPTQNVTFEETEPPPPGVVHDTSQNQTGSAGTDYSKYVEQLMKKRIERAKELGISAADAGLLDLHPSGMYDPPRLRQLVGLHFSVPGRTYYQRPIYKAMINADELVPYAPVGESVTLIDALSKQADGTIDEIIAAARDRNEGIDLKSDDAALTALGEEEAAQMEAKARQEAGVDDDKNVEAIIPGEPDGMIMADEPDDMDDLDPLIASGKPGVTKAASKPIIGKETSKQNVTIVTSKPNVTRVASTPGAKKVPSKPLPRSILK